MVTTTMTEWNRVPDIIGDGVSEQEEIMTAICETKGTTYDGVDCVGELNDATVYVSAFPTRAKINKTLLSRFLFLYQVCVSDTVLNIDIDHIYVFSCLFLYGFRSPYSALVVFQGSNASFLFASRQALKQTSFE